MKSELIKNIELHDLMELPWKKTFILMMRAQSLKNIFQDYKTEFSDFLQNNYHLIEGLTLLDAFRLENNLKLLKLASLLEGDIVECGCYKGGNAILMALWLKQNNISKKIFLFDSFEGLPEPDLKHDNGYKAGQFSASYDNLIRTINELELENYFEINKGWFKDTIPSFLKNNENFKISLMHIDCDLYESTIDCFPDLFKYLVFNGIAIFDDFNDGAKGEKIAVLECLKADYTFYIGPTPQSFLINNKGQNNGINDCDFYYNFDDISKNSVYLNWFQKVSKINYLELVNSFCSNKL